MKLLYAMVLACLFHFFGGCNSSSFERKSQTVTTASKFKAGQIWKYHNRQGEDSSTFTILKIETYAITKDTIIHIRIDGEKIYPPDGEGGYTTTAGHLPCSAQSISKSATEMVGMNESLPDFAEGYALWKKAWDEGKGGYFTAELKEVMDGLDQGMKNNK